MLYPLSYGSQKVHFGDLGKGYIYAAVCFFEQVFVEEKRNLASLFTHHLTIKRARDCSAISRVRSLAPAACTLSRQTPLVRWQCVAATVPPLLPGGDAERSRSDRRSFRDTYVRIVVR